jgi:hypothetical protein
MAGLVAEGGLDWSGDVGRAFSDTGGSSRFVCSADLLHAASARPSSVNLMGEDRTIMACG